MHIKIDGRSPSWIHASMCVWGGGEERGKGGVGAGGGGGRRKKYVLECAVHVSNKRCRLCDIDIMCVGIFDTYTRTHIQR